jgi:hypothetical protein
VSNPRELRFYFLMKKMEEKQRVEGLYTAPD